MGKEQTDGTMQKKQQLLDKMEQYANQDVMVAFSGGVDSGLLLKLACEAAKKTGRKVYGVTVQTKLHPSGEMEAAKRMAKEIGAQSLGIAIDELKGAGIMDNPVNRCYLCKKYLFQKMKEEAHRLGVSIILEGTNEDDLHIYRPGIRALRELQIVSPLALTHITKEEVRSLAAQYGLSMASKPAAPCLATRFPYGTALTYEKMRRVEKGENYLKSLGFQNVRLRVHDTVARLELDTEEFSHVILHKDKIAGFLKELGYSYITLDLEGFRSGSMDISIAEGEEILQA